MLKKSLSKIIEHPPSILTEIFEERGVKLFYDPSEGIYAEKNDKKHPIPNIFNAEMVIEGLLVPKTYKVPLDNVGPLFHYADKVLSLSPVVSKGRVKGFTGENFKILTDGTVIFTEINSKNMNVLMFIKKHKLGTERVNSNV